MEGPEGGKRGEERGTAGLFSGLTVQERGQESGSWRERVCGGFYIFLTWETHEHVYMLMGRRVDSRKEGAGGSPRTDEVAGLGWSC